jgi:hypothetical protein
MLLERAHSGESATYSVDTEVLSQSGIGDVASLEGFAGQNWVADFEGIDKCSSI